MDPDHLFFELISFSGQWLANIDANPYIQFSPSDNYCLCGNFGGDIKLAIWKILKHATKLKSRQYN